jgi:hypothetical protein
MLRKLFFAILEGVRDHDSYFECKAEVTGKFGFTSYKSICSAAICMFAYGVSGDLIGEYLLMSDTNMY